MPNPFMDAIQRGRTAVKAQLDPQGLARDRAAVDAENMRQGLLPIIASLRPDMAALVQNKDAFNAAMQNPSAYYNLSSASANAEPTAPKPVKTRVAVTGDEEIGKRFGLRPGQQGIMETTADPTTGRILNRSLVDYSEADGAGGGSAFGNSIRGLAAQRMLEEMPPGPERDKAEFLLAREIYEQPSLGFNAATGLVEQRNNTMSPELAQLLGFGAPGAPVASAPGAAAPAAGAPAPAAPTGAPTASDAGSFAALPSGGSMAEQIWAGNLSGPVNYFDRWYSQFGGILSDQIQAGETVDAAKASSLLTNKLVSAFRRSPRFAETDRKDLEKDYQIGPEFFTSRQNQFADMVQVILNVDRDIANHASSIREGGISGDERKRRMDLLTELLQLRDSLGPEVVTGTEEAVNARYAQLPVGAQMIIRNPEVAGNPWILIRKGAAQ